MPIPLEHILVVPTPLFRSLGYFEGFSPEIERYSATLLDAANGSFRLRSEVEGDPNWKQLIPYILLCHTPSGGETSVFTYVRGAGMGEGRLHSKRSVGIGGHIALADQTAIDDQLAGQTGGALYREGMRRELNEEVLITTTYRETCVGLINDDSTEVGRVHLGIVHRFDLDAPSVVPRESDIIESGFVPVNDLLSDLDRFETWSAICLKSLFGVSSGHL